MTWKQGLLGVVLAAIVAVGLMYALGAASGLGADPRQWSAKMDAANLAARRSAYDRICSEPRP